MNDILNTILARKAEEVATRRAKKNMAELNRIAADQAPARGFVSAVETQHQQGLSAVIAEVKKASPSKGVLRADFDPKSIAERYQAGGAACLSVLTDVDFFQGSDRYLELARAACQLPVLRKDFVIEPYQIAEARALGADCVLLIAAALDDEMLSECVSAAAYYRLDVLLEVHDQEEMARAIAQPVKLIGVNNRNLRTFETRLHTSVELLSQLPADRILVSESGIHSKADVELLRSHKIDSFLVGEAFMRQADPGNALRELFFG